MSIVPGIRDRLRWVARYLLTVTALAAIYYLAARLGLRYATIGPSVSLVWPPTGIALAALAALGYRYWPGVALGAFLANASTPVPLAAAAGIAVGNTLEGLVAAYLLRRAAGARPRLDVMGTVRALVLVAAPTGALVGAGAPRKLIGAFVLALLALFQVALAMASPQEPEGLTLRVAPESVLVEREAGDGSGARYLNFDFLITNRTTEPVELRAVRVSVHDSRERLLLRRFCDTSGISPCIQTVPDRMIPAGATGIVYNPFHTLPGDLAITELRYELEYGDTAGSSGDTLRTVVRAREYTPHTAFTLPLRGRLLVFDGHDFYAHHRRWNLAHPILQRIGFDGNSGRYAYDLSVVDQSGRMHRGDGRRNEDWFSWNAPVFAPGRGTVVAAANDEPDWEVGGSGLPDSVVLARPVALFGNYVIISHENGEYSLVAHLRRGSVAVKAGDRVRAGEPIGRVGFSGSVYTIHTHYQLQRGPGYAAEGLPSYFNNVERVGGRTRRGSRVRIDSGDVVDSYH